METLARCRPVSRSITKKWVYSTYTPPRFPERTRIRVDMAEAFLKLIEFRAVCGDGPGALEALHLGCRAKSMKIEATMAPTRPGHASINLRMRLTTFDISRSGAHTVSSNGSPN